MSSINEYQSLKVDGTWIDRLKYVLVLSDKSHLEKSLKKSLEKSSDDLQIFIFLSNLTKNDQNLLDVFQNQSLPVKQRVSAGKSWLKLQKDPTIVQNFLVETINDKNEARFLKHQILKDLGKMNHLKKSRSFCYELACRLTEKNSHEQYNIDAHLGRFCNKEQIFDLLSRWSITRLEQINKTSAFYSTLIRSHPLVLIHLIKQDFNYFKNNSEKFSNYFGDNATLIELIAKKEAKELICLFINYLNQLEKHQRFLPNLIELKQKYFFKKAPEEMIELITIVASNQSGSIKVKSNWGNDGSELGTFAFPRSFSIENYLRLFFALYETCQWSTNHTIRLVQYMLENKEGNNLSSIKKRQKWFFDIVVGERIGKEIFLKKLLKEGNENTLRLLDEYPQLTTSLSQHLLSKYERNGLVKAQQRLTLIRYQLMTNELFEQFLLLFKKTGSDVNQRQINYPLFFQCALSTNEQFTSKVLQWIEKRLTNEQLMVIEHFLDTLSTSSTRFQLEILPKNFQSIENIVNLGLNHLQRSNYTLTIVINYGINLLQRVEQYQNKEQKLNIQTFATNIIKKCYSLSEEVENVKLEFSESYPEARRIMNNILLNDVLPKMVSKCLIDKLDNILSSFKGQIHHSPQIDEFLNEFFRKSLLSSKKLQSAFQIDRHSTIISLFLENKSTRLERVNLLINQIDRRFLINPTVQRIVLRSPEHRQLISKLIEDEKCLTIDKLTNEQNKLSDSLKSETINLKLPGFDVNVLNSSLQFFTGKQQEYIQNIILNDYLQDKQISNTKKLKSLKVLRCLKHRYNEVLRWISNKEKCSLVSESNNEGKSRRSRTVGVEALDDIILCLPATFDLPTENLLEYFHVLKSKINASNAKFISDAMLNISRKIPDEIFLKCYLEFVQHEQFQKLGITANKEILRLLIEYVYHPSLVRNIIEPLWKSHPHQDVRACLILTLLHFLRQSNSPDDQIIIWQILEEAADDEYLPVVQSLFINSGGQARWPLTPLKNCSHPIFQTFVNRIQLKILDHPESLAARSWAWSYIDQEFVHVNQLIEKAQHICIRFDKDANHLLETAFEKLLSLYKQQKISSIEAITDVLTKLMSRREEIDSKENALDSQHDLPVYHRIQRLLRIIISHLSEIDNERKIPFRSLAPIILQFDCTLAPQIGTLLIKISQKKEDLENALNILQQNLSDNYFQMILPQLAALLIKKDSCSFVQLLNVDEKLHLAQWFIQEKSQPLFVWNLLQNNVFNQSNVDQKISQDLIRQMRQSEDLYLRQLAMEYTVPWNEDGVTDGDDRMSVSDSDHSDMS